MIYFTKSVNKLYKYEIAAEIVADSINQFGDRLVTLILTMPRFILAELNTHRMLSKNSASSRAIPFKVFNRLIADHPFVPIAWQKAHSGMQGQQYFLEEEAEVLNGLWIAMSAVANTMAEDLDSRGVTKQLVNRTLEPYMWHKVLISGTEWDNFLALRAHSDAEIHIAKLADCVLEAMNNSKPQLLNAGEWHIPFGDSFEQDSLVRDAQELNITVQDLKLAVAIARCARVSYNNFNGSAHDYVKDYELFTKLFINQPIHASPAEHVARCMSKVEYLTNLRGSIGEECVDSRSGTITFSINDNNDIFGWCRNFKGWIQYRTTLPNDTVWVDPRLTKYVLPTM